MKGARYEILIVNSIEKTSYYKAASIINKLLTDLALFDTQFLNLEFVSAKSKGNLNFSSSDLRLDNQLLAEQIYSMYRNDLNKMYPDVKHDIFFEDHYGMAITIHTVGEPLQRISFNMILGRGGNQVNVKFPLQYFNEFEWYMRLLSLLIDLFSAEFGCLLPVKIFKIDPPRISPGWVTYFAPHIALPPDAFEGCTALPLPNGQVMHAIENNHMVAKDEVQFEKLKALVEKFRAYDLKL
jgi:hypothetical protein